MIITERFDNNMRLIYYVILVISGFYLMVCIDGVDKNILALSQSQNYTNGPYNNTSSSPSSLSEEVTREQIINELAKITDPEIGASIIELELVDNLTVNEGNVTIDLHFTSPFEPSEFAFRIAEEIRDNISSLPQVSDVKVNVNNHFIAEAINQEVNQPKITEEPRSNSSIASGQSPNSTQSNSHLANNTITAMMVEEKLRHATPGEILKLNLYNYSSTLYLEALENLSPQELATALSKITSAYNAIHLTNATSQQLTKLLSKLSPEDLAIAFTYQLPDRSVIEKLDRGDLSTILTKLSPYDLSVALSKLESGDTSRALGSLYPSNLTRILNELSPSVVTEEFMGYKTILDAMSYAESVDLLSKQSPEDLALVLKEFDRGVIKDVLENMPPVKSGIVLNNLTSVFFEPPVQGNAGGPGATPGPPAPAGNAGGPGAIPGPPGPLEAPGGTPTQPPSGGAAFGLSTMLHTILSKASLEDIIQIPFTEYSVDVVAQAVTGLTQEKQNVILDKLPEDTRSNILQKIGK